MRKRDLRGKPALDWVVERQCVKTDKDSGIVNDANAWALETMHNPRYPLDLFLRVITVSLETMKLVNALPGLEIKKSCESNILVTFFPEYFNAKKKSNRVLGHPRIPKFITEQ